MTAIFKFILNLLFYSSNSYIKKFRILCPTVLIDCRNSPEINDLIDSIDLNNKKTLLELSLQMRFYKIKNIWYNIRLSHIYTYWNTKKNKTN